MEDRENNIEKITKIILKKLSFKCILILLVFAPNLQAGLILEPNHNKGVDIMSKENMVYVNLKFSASRVNLYGNESSKKINKSK